MKICWFGIYRPEYPRNDILLGGLRKLGIDVVECRSGGYERFRYIKLLYRYWKLKKDFDLVYAAFPAPTAVILAKILTRKPIVVDAFYSMYDAVVDDRREIKWWHPRALKLMILDWLSVFLADLVIVDTDTHGDYWGSWKFINRHKIKTVYIGVNEDQIFPQLRLERESFLVSFHGSYIPLQGVDKIIKAANILQDEKDIVFRMIGSGQEYQKARSLSREYNLNNVEFIERVPASQINDYLSEADVVLGIFGNTLKASRVIPNKVYEGMAASRTVITMDSPAIREIFSSDELCIVPNIPEDLAQAIVRCRTDKDFCDKLARSGYKAISNYLSQPTAERLVKIFNETFTSINR